MDESIFFKNGFTKTKTIEVFYFQNTFFFLQSSPFNDTVSIQYYNSEIGQ